MLTEKQIELVKSSVPFLQEHGVEITSIMYSQMLANNPELRQIFNQGHQRTGRQQISLAAAVLAYAQNIENPIVLFNAVKHIASKHVSLNIRAEHYPIVGKHLLDAIEKVLGDKANDEILDAWAAAYAQLAEILIKTESELYEDCANSVGGWSGWRSFRISNKKKETEDVTSFILEPVDGGVVREVIAGQFISVRTYVKSQNLIQPRQYTVNAYDEHSLRISIREIRATADKPAGMVSSTLVNDYQEGDLIDVAPPLGEFILEKGTNPIVLITAGIGITPAIAMLRSKDAKGRTLIFFHTCRDEAHLPHREEIEELITEEENRALITHFTADQDRPTEADIANLIIDDATYYVCGPQGFMDMALDALISNGVPNEAIRFERFSTGR